MSFDMRRLTVACCLVLAATVPLAAQREAWTRPFPAHRVVGNLYAVGTYDLGVFLITSQDGHILINTGLEDSTALIRASIESLGFRLEDVKILLTMQAHWDHTAALAKACHQNNRDVRVWAFRVIAHKTCKRNTVHRLHHPVSNNNVVIVLTETIIALLTVLCTDHMTNTKSQQ